MILAEPTRYGTGIFLYGDELDLKSIHSTIHDLTSERFFVDHLLNVTISLAYDIRKAYEGQRETKEMGYDEFDNKIVYLGVKMFWPYFLPQLGMLRWSAGFQDTTKKLQAHLYILEAIVEEALLEYDPKVGREVVDWMSTFHGLPSEYLTQFIEELQREYVSLPNGKTRFRQLPNVLRKMSPMSVEYREFKSHMEIAAQKNNCSPHELSLRYDDNEPNFKW